MKIQMGNLLFEINDPKKICEILDFISDRIEDIPEFECPDIPDYGVSQAKWVNGKGWELPKPLSIDDLEKYKREVCERKKIILEPDIYLIPNDF